MSDIKKAIAKNKWRNYCLVFIAIGTNLATIYTLFNSAAGNYDIANFEFPQQIKLNSGKLIAAPDSTNVDLYKRDRSQTTEEVVKSDREYQYVRDDSKVDLNIGYIVNTRGDVESYLKNYTNIPPKVIQDKKIAEIEIGHYALLKDKNRAYLSSCVSPRSPSNVTQQQFSGYRYQNDFKLQVGWEWLWGKSSIRDRRCLWVHLSTPLVLEQTAYQTLEIAWREIYPWLSSNFPSLR